jgi:methylmalonyl-CoA/ethylmalonyl-CoA epimerase
LADEAEQLLKMLSKSIKTAKQGKQGETSPIPNAESPVANIPGCTGLDHLAIAVPDTETALKLWRDTLGLKFLYSEDVNDATVRLTHLEMGNAHLQLVEPLTPDHPLQAWLKEHGPGLHHFCMKVANIEEAKASSPVPTAPAPHQGTQGKRALFLDKSATHGVQVELTGD